jgi:hypothetical protein
MSLRLRALVLILVTTLARSAFGASPQQGGGGQQDQSAQTGASQATTSEPGTPSAAPANLSGPEELSPGKVNQEPSYILPSLRIIEHADSNALLVPGVHKFDTIDTIVLGLAGESIGRHSRTVAEYGGGFIAYNQHSSLDATEHQLGVTWSFQGARWNWLVDERASLLPESAFGYGGFGWLGGMGLNLGGAAGSNLASLNPNFNPSESLFNSRGNRFSDGTALAVEYLASPRSSVSMSASYGTLTFLKRGSIDSVHRLASISYNHSLTARDYVGLSYGLSLFQFQPIGEAFKVHFVEFVYGHRVRGKTSFDFGAGPQFAQFNSPFFGTSTTATWVANGSVHVQSTRNTFALSAMRYTSNGGGVLAGSITDLVGLSWGRQIGRKWRGSVGPGYARNTSLPKTGFFSTPQSTYDSVSGEASLSRGIGRNMNMFLQYNLGEQTLRSTCTTGRCSTAYLRHLVGLGIEWHRRPISVE